MILAITNKVTAEKREVKISFKNSIITSEYQFLFIMSPKLEFIRLKIKRRYNIMNLICEKAR